MICACPTGQQRIVEKGEDVAILLFTRCDCGPNALTPAHTGITACALSDPAINHAMTNLTFRAVVGRLHSRVCQETEISLGGFAFKPSRQRFRKRMVRRPSHSLQEVVLDPVHASRKPGLRQLVATMQCFE